MTPLSGRQLQRQWELDDEMDLHPHPDEAFYLADMAEAHDVMAGEFHGWAGVPAATLELTELTADPMDDERRAA